MEKSFPHSLRFYPKQWTLHSPLYNRDNPLLLFVFAISVFASIEISYSNTVSKVCNKSAAEALKSGGTTDFIVTCIFLRIITFFIKIQIWYQIIFSIFFTRSKFNETWKKIITSNNKFLIILMTYVYYFIDLSTKNRNVKAGFIFYKNKKYR